MNWRMQTLSHQTFGFQTQKFQIQNEKMDKSSDFLELLKDVVDYSFCPSFLQICSAHNGLSIFLPERLQCLQITPSGMQVFSETRSHLVSTLFVFTDHTLKEETLTGRTDVWTHWSLTVEALNTCEGVTEEPGCCKGHLKGHILNVSTHLLFKTERFWVLFGTLNYITSLT